jgi:putative flippase GtrA
LTNIIDPGSTNIIDLYLVVAEYYTAYQNYIKDTTGTVPEPSPPTISELSTAYAKLDDYKMISDNLVPNTVVFKPLFGPKAAASLRATIKVVKAPKVTATVSEIKSQVIANVNNYFTIDKWDFGDSFFFSELAAYLHTQMGSIISSVVLVPLNPLKSFGDLYEIRSAPNEIFVNGATVADVQVIDALTQSNIQSQTPVSGLYPVSVSSTGRLNSTLSQTGEY